MSSSKAPNNSDSKKDIRQRIRNASSSAASNAANKNINTSYGRSNSIHTLSSHSRHRRHSKPKTKEVFIPRPRTPLNNEDSLTSSHSEEDVMQSVQDEIKLLRCEIGTLKDHVKQMLHNDASHKEEPPSSSSSSPITAMMMMPPPTIRKSNTSKDRKKEEPPSSSSPSTSSIPRMMPPDPPSDRHRDHGRGTENRSTTSPPDRYDRATNVRPRRFDFARPHEASNPRAMSATVVDPTVASVVDPPDEDDERRTVRCRIYRRIARTIVILISAVAFLELGAILKQQCCTLGTTLGTTLRTTLGKVSTFTTRSRQQHYYRVSQQTMDALHHFKSSPTKEIVQVSNSSFVITEGEVDLVCEKRNHRHHHQHKATQNKTTLSQMENERDLLNRLTEQIRLLKSEGTRSKNKIENLQIGLEMLARKLSAEAKEDYEEKKGRRNNSGLRNDVDRDVGSVLEKTNEGNHQLTSELEEDARRNAMEHQSISSASCHAISIAKEDQDESIETGSMEGKEKDESTQYQLLVTSDIGEINDTIHDGNDDPNDGKDPKYDMTSSETFAAPSNESSRIEREIDSVDDDNDINERAISKHRVISSEIAVDSIHQYDKNENTPQFLISSRMKRGVDVVDNGNDRDIRTTPNFDAIPTETAFDPQKSDKKESIPQFLVSSSKEGEIDTVGSDRNDLNSSMEEDKASAETAVASRESGKHEKSPQLRMSTDIEVSFSETAVATAKCNIIENHESVQLLISSSIEGTNTDTINDDSDRNISKCGTISSATAGAFEQWSGNESQEEAMQLLMPSGIEGINTDTVDDDCDHNERRIPKYDLPFETAIESNQCNKNDNHVHAASHV